MDKTQNEGVVILPENNCQGEGLGKKTEKNNLSIEAQSTSVTPDHDATRCVKFGTE
jgi:hypothetical protein